MSIPLSVQTNPTQNSHNHLEKPTNIDNMEDVHLHMALPLQKSDDFSTLWRTSELHIKKNRLNRCYWPSRSPRVRSNHLPP